MQIHSLKLTIQDIQTRDGAKLAVVMGSLFIDDGKVKKTETGEIVNDYETIQFTTALGNSTVFKNAIQEMIIEALTLKNLQIAKKNGQLTHFLEASGVQTKLVVKKRVSKTRK